MLRVPSSAHRSLAVPAVIAALAILVGACSGGGAASPTTSAAVLPSSSATGSAQPASSAPLGPESMPLKDLYELAKAEGQVTVYGGGGVIPEMAKVFEAQFPGVKVSDVDSTADDLVTRAIAEARGGRILGDVWQSPMDTTLQMKSEDLVIDVTPAEAADYPDNLKGAYWTAVELQFLAIGWNTNLVAAADAPHAWEDLADPKWKDKLIADPRDVQLMMTLALDKYAGDEQKSVDLFTKIAANNPEFHKGRRELAEQLLPAGERAVCFTCNTHHFPPLQAKGAPVDFELDEGIGQIVGSAVFKSAPHPNAAMLFYRWMISKDGQVAWATKTSAGNERIPALPSVDPVAKVRPAKIYLTTPEVFGDNIKHYTDLWNGIFNLR